MEGENANMIQLKGLTIEQALEKIKTAEKGRFYQIYIIERKTIFKDFKKCFKNHHLYDEEHKRIYYTTETLYYYYAQNKDQERQNIVIDSFIEEGHHSTFNFSRQTSEGTHNDYFLVVKQLQKGNKGKAHRIKTDKKTYRYKESELTPKQRRFTL